MLIGLILGLFDWLNESINRINQKIYVLCGWKFHSNFDISWLQIFWDITPESQYLIIADSMRYYKRSTVSHGCRLHEIMHLSVFLSYCFFLFFFVFLSFCLFSTVRCSYSQSIQGSVHPPTFSFDCSNMFNMALAD